MAIFSELKIVDFRGLCVASLISILVNQCCSILFKKCASSSSYAVPDSSAFNIDFKDFVLMLFGGRVSFETVRSCWVSGLPYKN